MNEWVPVKGCILRVWTYGPCGVNTTSVETLDVLWIIVIQVVCWVELPEQRRLCPIFVKIWILINGTQYSGIGSPKIHINSPGLTGCQRDPRIWGVTHKYSSHYIIKFIGFMSIYYVINLDIVSSCMIFSNLYISWIYSIYCEF